MTNISIDKKDLLILKALDTDVRASFTQLGKRTKLSKETVQYRIKRLEEKGIITGYWTIPTIKSDTFVYKILLKNKSLGEQERKQFINFAVNHNAVSWFATTEGNWDFIISSYVKDNQLFGSFVEELLTKFGVHFKERILLKGIAATTLNEKYLHNKQTEIQAQRDDFLQPPLTLDKTDNQIIRLLAENARASYTEIGKEVELTSEAISLRFKKLKQLNAIQAFKPRINHHKLGFEYYHLFISLQEFKQKKELLAYYQQHQSCVFIMEHIGEYDVHLELVMKPDQVQQFITELSEHFGSIINSYELLHIAKEYLMVVKA